jgi:hypothetical protein
MWWSNGVYLQVTNLDHPQQLDDPYGHLWVRTVVGLSF